VRVRVHRFSAFRYVYDRIYEPYGNTRLLDAPLASLPAQSECDARGLTIRDFAPQQIASFHCVGDRSYVDCAWHYLHRIWLPSGAFEPADLPAMEMFIRLPEEIGWQTFDLQACIPVVWL
jgi:hypothetical protein